MKPVCLFPEPLILSVLPTSTARKPYPSPRVSAFQPVSAASVIHQDGTRSTGANAHRNRFAAYTYSGASSPLRQVPHPSPSFNFLCVAVFPVWEVCVLGARGGMLRERLVGQCIHRFAGIAAYIQRFPFGDCLASGQ